MKDMAAGERRDLAEQGHVGWMGQVFAWIRDGQGGVHLAARRSILAHGDVVDARPADRQRRLVLTRSHLLEGEGPAGAAWQAHRTVQARQVDEGAAVLQGVDRDAEGRVSWQQVWLKSRGRYAPEDPAHGVRPQAALGANPIA